MKLYNRTEFLKLPPGVFYCKGIEWAFQDICIKGDTLLGDNGEGIDWWYQDLNSIEYDDSNQYIERLEEMKVSGASYPLNDSQGRDGLYDADAIFLVYELHDAQRLGAMAIRAAHAAAFLQDPPLLFVAEYMEIPSQGLLIGYVTNPFDTRNFDGWPGRQLKLCPSPNPDGRGRPNPTNPDIVVTCVGVERFAHMPPFKQGETVGIAFKWPLEGSQ